MIVKAATVAPEQLDWIRIHINDKHYTERDTAKILEETGGDWLIGGPIFLWDAKTKNPKLPKGPCCHLKAAGEVLCAPSYTVPAGIPAWDTPADWGVSRLPISKASYIQCVPLIRDGKAVTPISAEPDMRGRTYRQAIGGKAGRIAYCASTAKYTPEEMQAVLLAAGWDWAEMLDGGGSVVFADRDGGAIRCDPGRVLYSYIVFKRRSATVSTTSNDKLRARVLAAAAKEIGTVEIPAGSNRVKYNQWFWGREVSGASYPWCMAFVQYIFSSSGLPLPVHTASCTVLANYAKTNKQWVTKDFKPGDILFMHWSKSATATEHTGIVESVHSTYITTIEGNTSLTSQDNGGAVMRRNRAFANITGAYRPWYNM